MGIENSMYYLDSFAESAVVVDLSIDQEIFEPFVRNDCPLPKDHPSKNN